MFGALIFGAMGIALIIMAASGALTGSIHTLQRGGGDLILQSEQELLFWIWFFVQVTLGLLSLSLTTFMLWGARKTKAAEDRFFRYRDLYPPKKDQ